MRQNVLLDTGPLIAFLRKQERFHQWVLTQWDAIKPPFLTCEAVLSEACFLMRDQYPGQEASISMVAEGTIQIAFQLSGEIEQVQRLLTQYQSVPMSLADGCLVRMAEMNPTSELLTFDSDFTIYRKNSNQLIPVIMPER